MSLELESAYESLLFRNELPVAWRLLAFRSEANLRDFLKDLDERVKFFQSWIDGTNGSKFWLKAFFLPQAFLTAVQLNFARTMSEVSKKQNSQFRVPTLLMHTVENKWEES